MKRHTERIQLRLERGLAERLRYEAEARDVSQSWVVRQALRAWFGRSAGSWSEAIGRELDEAAHGRP